MSQRQKPRRTIELLDTQPSGSISIPRASNRISRIAQPIRQSSSNKRSFERAASCERLSTAKSCLLVPPSACKRQRSISATPQRTPGNSIPQNPSGILLTLEKAKAPIYDKKWLQIESNRINDYLLNIENILGSEFFERGGIKSLSTKQFITIVQYFTKKICGNRLTIGSNHVDSIANILTKIQYPYTINKSWLKTPTAPHALNNLVLLFSWFISFDIDNENDNSTLKTINEFEKTFITSGNIFPDEKYTIRFLKQTRDTFNLWNNGSEYEHLQKELKNELISKRIDLISTDELEEDINRLNFEIDEIISKKEVNNNADDYYKLDNEIKIKKKKINKLEENCKNYEKQINQLRTDIDQQKNLIKDVEIRIEEIQKNVSKQKMNITERNEFIKELNQLNYELQIKQKSVIELQDISNKNQVILSRVIRKKTDLSANLNTHLYTIFNEIDNLKKLNIEDYSVQKDANDGDIDKIINFLLQIRDEITKNIDDYNREINELENELSVLVYKHDSILVPKLELNKKQKYDFEEKIKNVTIELINDNEKFHNEIDELNKKINHLELSNRKIVDELTVKRGELKEMKTENETMWLKLEKKLEEILDYRENGIKKLNDLVDDFNNTIDELRSNLKDIL